jgi:hypothetical protein
VDAGDKATTIVVIIGGDSEIVVRCPNAGRADLSLIDALARLQLVAQRMGWSLRVRGPSAQLRALIDFVGLAGVLALEPGGEAEVGEELGVEEVVDPRDPPA